MAESIDLTTSLIAGGSALLGSLIGGVLPMITDSIRLRREAELDRKRELWKKKMVTIETVEMLALNLWHEALSPEVSFGAKSPEEITARLLKLEADIRSFAIEGKKLIKYNVNLHNAVTDLYEEISDIVLNEHPDKFEASKARLFEKLWNFLRDLHQESKRAL